MPSLITTREICVQLTNACPLRCVHCSTRGGPRAPDEMTDPQITRLIRDFTEMGGKVIEFSGGEPLVHPRLSDFIGMASSLGIETRLYSSGVLGLQNGVAIRPDDGTWLELRQVGLQKVYFNLQAEVAALHESVTRIRGSFDSVLSSIRAAKGAGLYVGVHFVPMAPNLQHLEGTYRLAEDLGLDEFAVLRLVLQGRAADNRSSLALTQSEFFEALRVASKLQREAGRTRVRLGCPLNHRLLFDPTADAPECRAGDGVCHVRPNGDIVPCSGLQHSETILGNVRETSLIEAWTNGPVWADFRNLRSRGPTPGSVEFIKMTGEPCLAQLFNAPTPSRVVATSKAESRTDSGILAGPV